MRVTLARHGGLAAAIRLGLPPLELDTDTLPGAAAEELARLVAAAAAVPAEDRPGRAGDAMSYTITVEEGGRSTELTQSDTTMTPEFAALLGRLEEHLGQR
ncbi:protealysin inhibitor emfourin [Streptomyces sp. NPDC013455]|uniref:protealysin inhibitor emfourin n=1 Tax=Streptomyces sp. NPDC013455 TaxID=3155605 RepID=UPI0033E53070